MYSLKADCYAIINHGGKNELALITSVTASTVTAYLNKDLENDGVVTTVKVPIENVVASLGTKPKIGAAYGVKIEPFFSSEEHDRWGTISYYRAITKKERKCMRQALDRTAELLDKRGLSVFMPVKLEIRDNNGGKYLGYYKHSKKDEVPSVLCLKPPSFLTSDIEPEDIDYIIYHESGHGVWFTAVSRDLRARWVKLFEKRIKCKNIKQAQLDLILNNIYDYGDGGIKDYYKNQADDDEQIIINECLAYLKKIYKLTVEDIDLLIQEDADRLDKYWPSTSDISKSYPDISVYAQKSCIEFFAEGFSHFLSKNPLPKDVKALMKETFEDVRNR